MSVGLRCVKCSSFLLEMPNGRWCPLCNKAPEIPAEPDFEKQVISLLTDIRAELRKSHQDQQRRK